MAVPKRGAPSWCRGAPPQGQTHPQLRHFCAASPPPSRKLRCLACGRATLPAGLLRIARALSNTGQRDGRAGLPGTDQHCLEQRSGTWSTKQPAGPPGPLRPSAPALRTHSCVWDLRGNREGPLAGWPSRVLGTVRWLSFPSYEADRVTSCSRGRLMSQCWRNTFQPR